MLASFLTTILFSLSVIFASRSARLLGAARANLGRILLATIFLAIWAHNFGAGLRGAGMPWFFVSGVIGFGLGDLALFGALPRIGPRLAILLTQCLAAPIAAFTEWIWLGTRLPGDELGCAALILAGVAIALAPDHGLHTTRRLFWSGVGFGIGAATGQALGAVISRKAGQISAMSGVDVDGGTAAYQRILGGAVLTAAAIFFLKRMRKPDADPAETGATWRSAWPAVAGNAITGPTLGVGCYQWALKTTPSAIVLPIVATSPLVTLLLAWRMDGHAPTRRAVIGGILAVFGAAALAVLHGGGR
ncbi:MAG TPA: DMT family transporter [Chthoniobacteraceae bacterium]|nr:DMT family transporter [Chthoniobacteraceae bacterium]